MLISICFLFFVQGGLVVFESRHEVCVYEQKYVLDVPQSSLNSINPMIMFRSETERESMCFRI